MRRAAAPLSMIVALGGAAGCGEHGETARPTPGASAARPPAGDLSPAAPTARQIRGATATIEPVAQARGIAAADASPRLLAIATGGVEHGLTLSVGPPAIHGPLRLTAARGASRLPWWSTPHVGTDAMGRTIVTYPRCTGRAFTTCRAVAWSPDDRRERPVAGLSRVGGVLDVVADAGNVAVSATTDQRKTDDELSRGYGPRRSLWVRRGDGPARRVAVSDPERLAIHGDTLGVIRQVNTTDGIGGTQAAVLVRVDVPAARPRELTRASSGLGGQYLSGLTLGPAEARIVMAANGEDAHAQLRVWDGRTARLTTRPLSGDPATVVWLDRIHGLALNYGGDVACDQADLSMGDAGLRPCTIGRLTLRGD